MPMLMEKMKKTLEKLYEQIRQNMPGSVPNVEYVKVDYKTSNTPPECGWEPFPYGTKISGKDQHFWFRATFKTPSVDDNHYILLRTITGKEGKWDGTNPQGLLYLNGKMIQGLDTNHVEAYLEPDTEYVMHNYFYIGMIDDEVDFKVGMCTVDRRVEKLYYDMMVPYDVCRLLHANDDNYVNMMTVLEQTANLIDFRSRGSDEFFESVQKATDYLDRELYQKMCSTEGKPIVSCIGHTHIDLEWQWTRFQTREKIQRSFSTAKVLMDKYPEYKFMLSQPVQYQYLKESAPEKYAELKQLVKEGRWEPEGAMYVEADCNLSSGESLVRQLVYGKRFFKEEFDVDSKVLFLPDVFGYSAAMPQILKKCGVEYFITSKISWNETNMMPVDAFMWQGIDGTEIFTNFITTQGYTGPNPARYTTYVGAMNASQIKGTWNRFQQKEYGNRAITTFGHGDGGGGPTKEMLEQFKRLSKGLPGMPVAKMEFVYPYLQQLKSEFDEGCERTGRIPKWVGELYLEFHRGTYTSIAKNKRGNRKSEFMLEKAEGLSYVDMLNGGTYDSEGLRKCWEIVLHNQFHDILPGSSIKQVYDLCDIDYKKVADYCNTLFESKIGNIVSNLNTDGGVFVYNPLGFEISGPVKLDGKTVETTEVIPSSGWKVLKSVNDKCDVSINGLTAENKYYKMTVDNAGRIASLFDKRVGREVFLNGTCGNELQIFEDYPREYDAWEISDYYKDKMWVLDSDAEIEPIFDGTRAGFKVTRKYYNSTITQNIWLYSECSRIDFENDIDWHEDHQLLKASFPLDVHASSATYEIQYGHFERPTHQNNSWDRAKFETCGHKWVDISDNNYGVALLNDCKYGHSAEGTTLKLTMLKCATWPNPEADQGKHVFTYSLMPHVGDLRDSGVIKSAYLLNQPMVAENVAANNGKLADNYSLASCDKDNVIIECVKKAENDDNMIVRLYDAYNRRTNATVTVPDVFKEAYLCNMLEENIEKLDLKDGKVTVDVSNFEIVTVKFVR